MKSTVDGRAGEESTELLRAGVPQRQPDTWYVGGAASRLERLRSTALTLWVAWLIAAGVVIGGTMLAVVVRIAVIVLRWAVAA